MNYKQIKEIIKDFEDSKLTNLELEFSDFKVKLSKNCFNKTLGNNQHETNLKEEKSRGYAVKSPLVGTFYAASAPNEEAFVEVGDEVVAGQILCIIEAMKIMNEITAPISGRIKSINIKNASPVGYDQVLMVIE